jgi:hypothetical protein
MHFNLFPELMFFCIVLYMLDGDDYDTVKITEFLKKHITKHMYMLDDIVFQPFNNEALPKVKTEIYKFQKHVEDLKQARNKTLDVGGEYTKPLRNKLEKLNNELTAQLEKFYQKCYKNKMYEAEIIEMQQETADLYEGNRNVVKGAFSYYPEELERIVMIVTKETLALKLRRDMRQSIRDECSKLKAELSAAKGNYNEIKDKISEMGANLSYTSAEASTQGAHIILSLLSELLQFFETKQKESNGIERANVAELIARQRKKTLKTEVDTEKILRHILSYFGEDDFAVLGAVFLDESISRSMSQGLEDAAAEERLKQSTTTGLRVSSKQSDFEGTQIDAFNMTADKESKFRNGTGFDPRKVLKKAVRKMSTVRMDSFVNDQTLPTALKTTDALPTKKPVSRESRVNSRRPSVSGGTDSSNPYSRPTSQSRRPTSANLNDGNEGRRKPSSVGVAEVPLSRETNDHFEELSGRLLEQFIQPVYSPGEQKRDFQSIVPAGEKLAAFNDSECTSMYSKTVSTLTTKTKSSSRTRSGKHVVQSSVAAEEEVAVGVPLLHQQGKTTPRKATLALLSGGDGKVASYVAK